MMRQATMITETADTAMPVHDYELDAKLARMTLVVGLVGSDGIILAADTKAYKIPRGSRDLDDTYNTYKIYPSSEHDICHAYIGDQVSQFVGQEVHQQISSGTFYFNNIKVSLEEASRSRCRSLSRMFQALPYSSRYLLTVFWGSVEPQLWKLEINAPTDCICKPNSGHND